MKILNLYSGIGGNRALWGEDHDITAVDNHPGVCEEYARRYPNDTVICGEAIPYLEQHVHEFDFTWASPPCQTHSQMNISGRHKHAFKVPDMSLYGVILFLAQHAPGGYCVENVRPFYGELLPAQKLGRHRFWANFHISEFHPEVLPIFSSKHRQSSIERIKGKVGECRASIKFGSHDPYRIYRNCLDPDIGKHILDCYSPPIDVRPEQATLL